MLADRHQKGRQILVLVGIEQRRGKLLCTHGYDEGSMDVVEYHYNQHLGLLLIYELPDTVKQKVTEAEAYSTVWDIQMKLQHALPRSVVYYGQDTLKDGGTRYDELGVFLPLEHFADRLERHVETATKIVYGE